MTQTNVDFTGFCLWIPATRQWPLIGKTALEVFDWDYSISSKFLANQNLLPYTN
eukprot:gene3515-3850_t